jgi:hypothetical protein
LPAKGGGFGNGKPSSLLGYFNQGSPTEGEGSVQLTSLYSLDQLLFILKILLTSFTKQATLMRRSTVRSLPPQSVFLAVTITAVKSFIVKAPKGENSKRKFYL